MSSQPNVTGHEKDLHFPGKRVTVFAFGVKNEIRFSHHARGHAYKDGVGTLTAQTEDTISTDYIVCGVPR